MLDVYLLSNNTHSPLYGQSPGKPLVYFQSVQFGYSSYFTYK